MQVFTLTICSILLLAAGRYPGLHYQSIITDRTKRLAADQAGSQATKQPADQVLEQANHHTAKQAGDDAGQQGAFQTTKQASDHAGQQTADQTAKQVSDHAGEQVRAYDAVIRPFLSKYCFSCHQGEKASSGLSLDAFVSLDHARKDRKTLESVQRVVLAGEMPPERAKLQPAAQETQEFAEAIERAVLKEDCTKPRSPGRVTLRRLNRAEYANTIRDLVGVQFNAAEDFPSDDVGYGFDHIGDVLSVQPLLIEKYLAAADRILDEALPDAALIKPVHQIFRPQQLRTEPRSAKMRVKNERGREVDRIALRAGGQVFMEKIHFPAHASYRIRCRAWAESNDDEQPTIVIRVADQDLKSFKVSGQPQTFEISVELKSGDARVAAAVISEEYSGILRVETLEVEGPLGAEHFLPNSKQKILEKFPDQSQNRVAEARRLLAKFARRAYRRPVLEDEIDRLMELFQAADKRGDRFDQALKLPLKAILVSPHFLFRVENDPKGSVDARLLNDHELAVRLSYFLWSSMPDETLFSLAERGELRNTGVLEAQVKRMLADPKASALTDNFAAQWLMLRNIPAISPDRAVFPKWDEALKRALAQETMHFFEHIFREDRSVLEFLDSDYTFVNERLAVHYGIPNVKGPEFRKVSLPDRRRGGLIAQASILAVTSNPTRTSPVKRGKWIYENLLGLKAPPPAPDVPELPDVKQISGTLREQMEKHRANPNCAGCHSKLDPLGFGLENFDAIGAWRDLDNRKQIDASGVLPDGTAFDGPAELRQLLLAKAQLFRRCLSEKMLTYALGRGLEPHDDCVVNEIAERLKLNGDRFSALILAIVESEPFQKRQSMKE